MRIVIVGAGVVGLFAALEAAGAGHEVVLCERGTVPDPRAASHDRHRVLRALHPGDPAGSTAATTAALRADALWTAWTDRFAPGCYLRTGALTVLPAAGVAGALATLPSARVVQLPLFAPHPGTAAVFEPDAGVLLADRILTAAAGLLGREPRVTVRTGCEVTAVDGRGTVTLAGGGSVTGDALLVAAGAWGRSLLSGPLRHRFTVMRQSQLYCQPTASGTAWTTLPPVRGLGADGAAWLVPPVAGTPLKLSAATACREAAEVGDRPTPAADREHLTALWSRIVPGLAGLRVVAARDCHYLTAPGERSGGGALVQLGPAAWSFAACGGGAFKFAPLLAQALIAQLCGTGSVQAARLPYPTMRGVS